MKTYVIILSETFPEFHKRKGESTGFIEAIKIDYKIHTIRANYPLWRKRFEEIQAGKACLSIRYWSGKPYRSKQVELSRLTWVDGIGVQMLELPNADFEFLVINGKPSRVNEKELARNDGLAIEDFKEWFKNYDLRLPMAIIHFTKFRY